MNQTPIQSASLYFREGASDKVYNAAIEPKGDGYIVSFSYGRRGSTLSTGAKTDDPLPLATATKVFNKLIASKLAKGYQYTSTSAGEATPYQQTGNEGKDSGIRCQLLNAVEEADLQALLSNRRHCLQEKFDGRRMLIRKRGETITGINRRGLVIAVPDAIREETSRIAHDFLIDGEAVGERFHAFDMLELDGIDQRSVRYIDRFVRMQTILPKKSVAIRSVDTYIAPSDKLRVFDELKANHSEGVVFKEVDAPFSPGRPNSGGSMLKFKFVESASFVVSGHNAKRSVSLGLYDGDTLVPAGNVTIPPNHGIPQLGTVVECSYLYAFRESGSIYQPVYQGVRTDIPANECGVEQLKYKPEARQAAA